MICLLIFKCIKKYFDENLYTFLFWFTHNLSPSLSDLSIFLSLFLTRTDIHIHKHTYLLSPNYCHHMWIKNVLHLLRISDVAWPSWHLLQCTKQNCVKRYLLLICMRMCMCVCVIVLWIYTFYLLMRLWKHWIFVSVQIYVYTYIGNKK